MAIVTISRGSMSGGEAFANCLASTLGYPVLGREVLVEAAARLGVPEELLREKIQTSVGLFERLTTDRHVYLVALQSALADQCVSGDLIYHGNAGHFLLKDVPNVLRARLIAPMAMRVRAVMEKEGLSSDAAADYIRYVDQERIEWTKFVYGADWRDARNYDLIINLRRVSLESACAMVSGVVKSPAYATTEAVKKKLRDFAVACKVKVTLVARPKWQSIPFDVQADGGKVEIIWPRAPGGAAATLSEAGQEEVRQAVKTVEGVQSVTLHLREPGSSGRAA
ncbi:MAG TPA: cytidylate kinase-like family protein [Terriglobia bacterium]|nr:cytidylate kinase-like family protein [Terriglobia bacterium]